MPTARRSSHATSASALADAAKGKDKNTTAAATITSAPAPTSAEAGPSTSSLTKQQSGASNHASDKKEEPSTDAHLELLTEHFGYNPKSFIDALVYLSNEHLYSIAAEFENVVLELLKDVQGGELEAEQGIHAILTLMENALDHTLDTFELYCLRSVFGIRSRQARYMTLDHHRGLDLRTQQSVANPSAKAQTKSARKSFVGNTTTNVSANERSYQLGETEDSLKRQIAAARATQHKLYLAQNATQQSLNRMLQLAERFSSILYADDVKDTVTGDRKSSVPVLTETLGQHARKLKADTIPLLKVLGELRETDPLGAPLYSNGSVNRHTTTDDVEDDGFNANPRVWATREGYLNWEADRIITKSKRDTCTAPTPISGETILTQDTTLPTEDKTPKRKRTAGTGSASVTATATGTGTDTGTGTGTAPTSSKRRTPTTTTRSRS